MSDPSPPRAVIDADIIFSRVLHELIGRIARTMRLLDLIWSDELLEEAKNKLIERKGLADPVAERWVGYLRENFPSGQTGTENVLTNEQLGALTIDPDDRHVCALAIAGRAQFLFTHDRGYLREALKEHGIEVTRPDDFLLSVWAEQGEAMIELLERQASSWAGGRPLDELLNAIERAGAAGFVRSVRFDLTGDEEAL